MDKLIRMGTKAVFAIAVSIGVIATIVSLIAIANFSATPESEQLPMEETIEEIVIPQKGPLGNAHVHASIHIMIHGYKVDFSIPARQSKSSWIHFEEVDGNTIHRHATGVPLADLFSSLSMRVDVNCFVHPDGTSFCNKQDDSLKFFINHQKVPRIDDYIISDNDVILISYGNETPQEIEAQLVDLDSHLSTPENS